MLSAIIFIPVIGAIVAMLVPRQNTSVFRWIAAIFSGVPVILSLYVLYSFNRASPDLQFVEKIPWIPQLGVSYFVAVDGLSLPLMLLTGLLTFMAVLFSWHQELRPKEYFALLLILQGGVTGVFLALDLALFFLFWEVELIPMYLLIGIWGGPRREYAAIKFVIYTLAGSSMMLLGFLALYFYGDPHTFDMTVLATKQYAPEFQQIAFLFIFVGFAVKLPAFPFHTWLPDAHVEAPTAVSVLLAGVLLKMGGYGMFRILVGIIPQGVQQWATLIAVMAVIGILYGACVSLVQRDLKSLVAYSSISHMGYVLLGLAAFTVVSLNGAAIQLFTHGLITGLLFLGVGVVYEKAHTRMIADFGGLSTQMPLLATIFVIAGLASLGLPGLAGFVAEFTTFIGAYPILPVFTILAACGIVLTAGYILWMLQRAFFGPVNPRWNAIGDVRGVQAVPLVVLVALVLIVGIYPSILTDLTSSGIARVLAPHPSIQNSIASVGSLWGIH
jgi:NADH-quinone oxidoreductase subunit M